MDRKELRNNLISNLEGLIGLLKGRDGIREYSFDVHRGPTGITNIEIVVDFLGEGQ